MSDKGSYTFDKTKQVFIITKNGSTITIDPIKQTISLSGPSSSWVFDARNPSASSVTLPAGFGFTATAPIGGAGPTTYAFSGAGVSASVKYDSSTESLGKIEISFAPTSVVPIPLVGKALSTTAKISISKIEIDGTGKLNLEGELSAEVKVPFKKFDNTLPIKFNGDGGDLLGFSDVFKPTIDLLRRQQQGGSINKDQDKQLKGAFNALPDDEKASVLAAYAESTASQLASVDLSSTPGGPTPGAALASVVVPPSQYAGGTDISADDALRLRLGTALENHLGDSAGKAYVVTSPNGDVYLVTNTGTTVFDRNAGLVVSTSADGSTARVSDVASPQSIAQMSPEQLAHRASLLGADSAVGGPRLSSTTSTTPQGNTETIIRDLSLPGAPVVRKQSSSSTADDRQMDIDVDNFGRGSVKFYAPDGTLVGTGSVQLDGGINGSTGTVDIELNGKRLKLEVGFDTDANGMPKVVITGIRDIDGQSALFQDEIRAAFAAQQAAAAAIELSDAVSGGGVVDELVAVADPRSDGISAAQNKTAFQDLLGKRSDEGDKLFADLQYVSAIQGLILALREGKPLGVLSAAVSYGRTFDALKDSRGLQGLGAALGLVSGIKSFHQALKSGDFVTAISSGLGVASSYLQGMVFYHGAASEAGKAAQKTLEGLQQPIAIFNIAAALSRGDKDGAGLAILSFFSATAPIALAFQIGKALFTLLSSKPSFWAHGQMDLDAEGGYKYLNIGVGAGDVEGTTKAILKGMHQSLQEYADAVNQELGNTGDARLGVSGLRVPEVLVKGNDQGRPISVVLFYQHPREGQTLAAQSWSLPKLAQDTSKSIATDAMDTWTTCGFDQINRLKRTSNRLTRQHDCARGALKDPGNQFRRSHLKRSRLSDPVSFMSIDNCFERNKV